MYFGPSVARIVGMALNFRARQRRALAQVRKSGSEVGALLVTHLPDVRYLSGFTGTSGVLVLGSGPAMLYTDGRYSTQAKAEDASTARQFAARRGRLAVVVIGSLPEIEL